MRRFSASLVLATLVTAGCLPGSGPPLVERDAGSPAPPLDLGQPEAPPNAVDLGDPFALIGLNPSHGPWTGGTRARMSGRGFPSKLRVFLGTVELDPSAVLASDPTRAAITIPPGVPGVVDVRIRDEATARERTLRGGFTYEAFVVEPSTGATSGGTRIRLRGSGTAFAPGSEVRIAAAPCKDARITSATEIECFTPAGSPGAKDVTIALPDGSTLQAREAFTYADSPDGYRGGLAGDALSGQLRVLAFDSFTATPLADAQILVTGQPPARANAQGVASVQTPGQTKATVTIAAKCHQPITFVDVPVDTVTVYLDPILDLSCAEGDPPSSGNFAGRESGGIQGELVWPGGVEFARGGWSNVPEPVRPTERRAAYVFSAAANPQSFFYLPDPTLAITPESPGVGGYGYLLTATAGNNTIYALAGIEDRSKAPPLFVPYVMGVARGVAVKPGATTREVDIPMATLLDHRVEVAAQVPTPNDRGPDRLITELSVSLGASAYATFPFGARTELLPFSGTSRFVGAPALDGALAGEAYVVAARAVSGLAERPPASYVSRVKTTEANAPVQLGGFLPVPVPKIPGAATWNGQRVEVQTSGSYDLLEIVITSGGGLVSWRIAAPAGVTAFDLPDLSLLPDRVGLVHGPVDVAVHVARIDDFSYSRLRTGQLFPNGWNAYALDTLRTAY